jgi:hypothetical protein
MRCETRQAQRYETRSGGDTEIRSKVPRRQRAMGQEAEGRGHWAREQEVGRGRGQARGEA